MRVLIANTPLMYRESLGISLRRRRPDWNVAVSSPENLQNDGSPVSIDALICDKDALPGLASFRHRVEIDVQDHLSALVYYGERRLDLRDAGLDDILEALDGMVPERL